MKYDWEDSYVNNPDCHVIGHVVWNKETGQGALIMNEDGPLPHDVEMADICQDVLGDAESRYREAIGGIFAKAPKDVVG